MIPCWDCATHGLKQKVCTWEEREVLNEGEIITVSSDEAFEND